MPPAGLEPATLWLEAIRAIRLRHEGKYYQHKNCSSQFQHYIFMLLISGLLFLNVKGTIRALPEIESGSVPPKGTMLPLHQRA